MPARQSRTRTHTTETRTGSLQDEEQFDLGAVSGSEDESAHGRDVNPTAQGESSRDDMNDPDTIHLPKTSAKDIRYFYDKSGAKAVCNVCRQVFLSSRLFVFLN